MYKSASNLCLHRGVYDFSTRSTTSKSQEKRTISNIRTVRLRREIILKHLLSKKVASFIYEVLDRPGDLDQKLLRSVCLKFAGHPIRSIARHLHYGEPEQTTVKTNEHWSSCIEIWMFLLFLHMFDQQWKTKTKQPPVISCERCLKA